VHDLTQPRNAILAIENNLSGRQVGAPATELGIARILDENYPQILANYENRFSDGRPVKSTSIGIRDSSGVYVAALCLNIDMTQFRALEMMLGQFSAVDRGHAPESIDPANADAIRQRIDHYAASLAKSPRDLLPEQRQAILRSLKDAGLMDLRNAPKIAGQHLGISRATVYKDIREA